jgi:hypothetical protein
LKFELNLAANLHQNGEKHTKMFARRTPSQFLHFLSVKKKIHFAGPVSIAQGLKAIFRVYSFKVKRRLA